MAVSQRAGCLKAPLQLHRRAPPPVRGTKGAAEAKATTDSLPGHMQKLGQVQCGPRRGHTALTGYAQRSLPVVCGEGHVPAPSPKQRAAASDPAEEGPTALITPTRRSFLAGGGFGLCTCGCAAAMTLAAPTPACAGGLEKFEWYRKLGAASMEVGMQDYEQNIEIRKEALFALIPKGSKVMELGIGTGPNLKYYKDKGISVVGVEPNEYMDSYSSDKAKAFGVDLDVRRGTGEALPVEDASMDVVVSTLVMCTVDKPASVLKEVARVLKPGGTFIFIEHVAAEPGPLYVQQVVFNPQQQLLAGGCHLTRRTGQLIELAAQPSGSSSSFPEQLFESVEYENFRVPDAWLISPHVAGMATRA